jgi:hypothetical protein
MSRELELDIAKTGHRVRFDFEVEEHQPLRITDDTLSDDESDKEAQVIKMQPKELVSEDDFADSIWNEGENEPKNICDFKLCKIPGKEFLGEGSFGKVYLAQLRDTEEFYAVKAIRKSFILDFSILERTLLESNILQTNDHPNLMHMEFCFHNSHILFFVMKYI